MKKLILLMLTLTLVPLLHAGSKNWEEQYSSLLGKYVTPSGVRYAVWKSNPDDLKSLNQITVEITNSKSTTLDFYINAYNAWTIHNVLAAYPIKSIRDVHPFFGFFTRDTITVGGKKMSLNHLEKDIIIKKFHEPRVHAAINCASKSCPALRDEAFTKAGLDAQLDEQFDLFVNKNPLGVNVAKNGKSVAVSSIFKWYADDFKHAGGAVSFINKFRKDKLNPDIKVTFQDYEWNLNDAR